MSATSSDITRRRHGVLTRAVAPLLLLLGCDGCDPTPAATCTPACSEGFVCEAETNTCVAASLPPYTAPAPGRGVRVELVGQRPYIAAIDPRARQVVVGPVEDQQPALGILGRDVRPGSGRVGLAAGAGQVAVAWIGEGGFFHVATRGVSGEEQGWSVELARAVLDGDMIPNYSATDDFDLALDADGTPNIVFRDRVERSLYRLYRRAQSSEAWSLELIDDGSQAGLVACPPEARQLRRGLGQAPALLIAQDTVHVAYHDADCGDLRLALQGASGRWLISVLDRGGEDVAPGEVITGRMPTLALDGSGRPAVAYQDLSRARLMYGVLRGEDFEPQVVDAGEGFARTSQRPKKIVGAFAQLSFDIDGQPIITYFDGSDADAQRARGVPDEDGVLSWSVEALAEEGLVGFSLDHVITSAGLVGVAERLVPSEDGVSSELVVLIEEGR